MDAKKEDIKKVDKILDFNGDVTGVPITKRLVLCIPLAVIVYLLLSLLPLDAYGPMAAKGLAFFASVLIVLIMAPVNISVRTMFIVLGGFLLGFWDVNGIGSALGSSMFLQMTSMMIVAMGCEFTPFGKRVSYWLLKHFGQKPILMVIVVGAGACLLSAFISNGAVIVMMGSILDGVLKAMNEKPGESKFGKVVMLVLLMGAMVGGCVLFCGNPVGNGMSLQLMEASSGYTVTFAQWAFFGVPCFLVAIVPFCLIYVKIFKLKASDIKVLPKTYYQELLDGMGPIGGSEIRWVVIVVAMVALMLAGVNSTIAAMGCAFISLLPLVGTVSPKKVWSRMPFDLLFSMALIPIMGKLITTTGAADLLADFLTPALSGLSPLLFSMATALMAGIAVNALLNASSAVGPMFLSIIPPICVSMGYNPVVVMMPMIFVATFFFVMGPHTFMLVNYPYGYWDLKDPTLPGALCVLLGSILFPLIIFAVAPLIGLPIYL